MCGLKDWPQPPEPPSGPGWYDVTVTVRLHTFLADDEPSERDLVDAVVDVVRDLDFEIDDVEHRDDVRPEDIYDC